MHAKARFGNCNQLPGQDLLTDAYDRLRCTAWAEIHWYPYAGRRRQNDDWPLH
jgi:hypothetical protein